MDIMIAAMISVNMPSAATVMAAELNQSGKPRSNLAFAAATVAEFVVVSSSLVGVKNWSVTKLPRQHITFATMKIHATTRAVELPRPTQAASTRAHAAWSTVDTTTTTKPPSGSAASCVMSPYAASHSTAIRWYAMMKHSNSTPDNAAENRNSRAV